MRRVQIALVALLIGLLAACGRDALPEPPIAPQEAKNVFVNEIHYDNSGTDTGEFVEIAGTAGTDLDGYDLVLYNGTDSQRSPYGTVELSGVIDEEEDGFGALSFGFPANGLQNGAPDGLALVDPMGNVSQFLSYEGAFTAASGPAVGMTSTDIGVEEGSGTPVGFSLQLTGTGSTAGGFTWAGPAAASPGDVNGGQNFRAGDPTPPIVINELDADTPGSDTAEFVELYDGGVGNTPLDGLVVVFFNGSGDASYEAFDLDGQTTDENGFFVLGNPGVTDVDLAFDPGSFGALQNGADAVALYQGDAADFPNDTLVTTDNLLDAIVYDTDDGDDSGLLDGLGETIQFNEDANNDKDNQSNARVPDGTGAFVAQAPTPGEANEADDSGDGGGDVVAIYDIQGAALTSPLEGERVTTTGVVTAVDSNGFYLQDPIGDGDDATSDALFVFTSGTPGVSVADALRVSGVVSEFFPGGQGTGNQPTTQIGGGPTVTTLSTGNALPEPVLLGVERTPPTGNIDDDAGASFEPSTDGLDFFESLEGMRITVNQPLAVAPTSRFGEIFTVVNFGANADSLSERGTDNIGPQDFNPEKVQIAADAFTPGDLPLVDVGAELDNVTGVLGYSFGNYEVLATEAVTVADMSGLQPEVSGIEGDEDTLTVASYNVLNLDPNDGDGDADVANGRFDAIADQIVDNLNAPDVVALQEVQDNDGSVDSAVTAADLTLQTLVDSIETNGGPSYAFIDNTFIQDDASGGQPGGNIRVAFLYNDARVELVEGSVRPIGDQEPGSPFSGARLPLVAQFSFNGEDVTVVNNHFSSKGGSAPVFGVEQPFEERQEDVTVNGSLDERRAQSDAVQSFVNGLEDEDVVVLGDFNEFEFVSPVEELETGAGLNNLTETLPEDERYSFIFQGNSQSLDHILVSDSLLDGAEFDIVHVNSEFAETDARASDHDPLLAELELRPSDTEAPVITLKRSSEVLWPPNHKYEIIDLAQIIASVSDDVSDLSVADVVITRVSSDEPENGTGDGNTADDIVLEGCQTVKLRAERSGRGDGRVYTIELAVRDAAGNVGTATYWVEVPKGRKDGAVDSGAAYSVTGCEL